MDRTVRFAAKQVLSAGWLRPFFFGGMVERAVGLAADGPAQSVKLAADGWLGAPGSGGFGGREGSVSPSCLRVVPAQQCVQAEAASRLRLT
jgi:hypothetical protein